MIANDALAALHTKYQTTELNVQCEYMQHLFLSYFYQQPQASRIYFKGGTALRMCTSALACQKTLTLARRYTT
jgi:hypothetical protein